MNIEEQKQSLYFMMGQVFQDTRQLLDVVFNEFALTRNEWLILAVLRFSPEGLSQSYIKDTLGLEVSYFSKVLNSVEDKGYIIREIDKFDRRNRIVKLNPKAKSKTKKIFKIIYDFTNKVQADLSDKQVADLHKSLSLITGRLDLMKLEK
jgi:DNA-binding MarR family transcriptional regulator